MSESIALSGVTGNGRGASLPQIKLAAEAVEVGRTVAGCWESLGYGAHAAKLRELVADLEASALAGLKPIEQPLTEAQIHARAEQRLQACTQRMEKDPQYRRCIRAAKLETALNAAALANTKLEVAAVDKALGEAGITGHQAMAFKMDLRRDGVL